MKETMIDRKFGKWIVVSEVKTDKPGKHYECLCECGNVKIIPGTTLRAGKSTQCMDCMYNKRFKPAKMINRHFGKWTVIKYLGVKNRSHYYETLCDCGKIGHHYGVDLRAGKSTMCINCHNKTAGRKHGMHKTRIYKIWQSMRNRCNCINDAVYKYYGARGIKVCERWEDFLNFLNDMGIPEKGLTIDRIDNDGNYEKDNCRWVTHKENCNNRGVYNQGKKRKSKYNKKGEEPPLHKSVDKSSII